VHSINLEKIASVLTGPAPTSVDARTKAGFMESLSDSEQGRRRPTGFSCRLIDKSLVTELLSVDGTIRSKKLRGKNCKHPYNRDSTNGLVRKDLEICPTSTRMRTPITTSCADP